MFLCDNPAASFMMKLPPKPKALKTSTKPHAQLAGLQFYSAWQYTSDTLLHH